MALVFLRQLAAFRDPFAPWGDEAGLLLSTSWGRTWTIGVMCALLTPWAFRVAGSIAPSRSRALDLAPWVAATLLSAAACALPAFAGHASGTGALRPLTIPADILHVLAAGAWIGGLLASIVHIESWGTLFSSTYGRILLAKVGLVAVVAAMGAINWRRLTPRLSAGEGRKALRRNAMRELAVAHLVILATALLTRTPLPGA